MTRDLHDFMTDALTQRTRTLADTADDGDRVSRLRGAVRRRRTTRAAVRSTSVACVAVAVGALGWLVAPRLDDPEPATTPSPSVSTANPTPTSTPAAEVLPGLPPTRPMPPGLLQQTTPGWVLAIYRTTEGERDPDRDPVIVRNTVVLVSPAGESYRVLELPTDQWAELLRWEAGSTTAVVGMFGHGQPTDAARAVLDLESGVLTPTELGLGTTELYANYYQGQAADGAELWTVVTGSDAFTSDVYRVTENADPELVGMIGLDGLLDPSRRWLVSNVPSTEPVEPFALLDVVDGSRTEHSYGVPGQDCDVVGWLDPGQLLAFCLDAGYREAGIADPVAAHAAYYRIDVSPSAATPTLLARLGPSDPRPQTWRGGWAAPGTLAFGATSAGLDDLVSCPEAVYLWSGQEAVLTAIPHGARSYSVDSGLPLPSSSATGCEGDPETLQSFDPSTGASTVLAPEPLPAGDGTGATGVASWVVGS